MSWTKEEKTDSPATRADKHKAYLKRYLCTYRTAGRRCQLLAGHEDHGPESGLCGWHWITQGTPRLVQNYEEFVKYREHDRQTYPKEYQQAAVYVDDELVWTCILGKDQRREFVRALIAIENECEEELFGKSRHKETVDNPPTPEVSVQKYAESLPF